MHHIFLISVFSTVVYSGCCFNPYLRDHQDADQIAEYAEFDSDAAYDKREIARRGNEQQDEDMREDNRAVSAMRKRSVMEHMPRLGELNQMNDDDIAAALSRLSVGELDTLDRFIDEKVQESGGLRSKSDLTKRCGSNQKHSQTNQKPSHKAKRMAGHTDYFRRGRVSRLTPQQRVDAKINFMREKFKRQSALKRIEESRRSQQEKRDQPKNDLQLNDNSRNPYYNSLTGPLARPKRSSNPLKNPMDDPKSNEHLRLLQDSFPNPIEADSRADDASQTLVRVKRS